MTTPAERERVLATDVPVRPAATVMLIRDGADGVEVFMLQRTMSASFARGNYVFPGGAVDDADHGEHFEPICDGHTDASASATMELDRGGLAWLVAAIRECFEEAGVLLARRVGDDHVVAFDTDEAVERFDRARRQIYAGETSLVDLCAEEGLRLLTDRMHLVDHWLTPLGERRRFDTRFFLALAPSGQVPLHDAGETVASLWVRPVDAIAMWERGELMMFPPTVASMRFLEPFELAADAIEAGRAIGVPPRIVPRVIVSDEGRVVGVALPGQDGYDEVPVPEYVLDFPR